MYTENLPHVLNLLEISAQSGTLYLTPTVDKAHSSWQAIGILQEGKMNDLKLRRTADGIILLGGTAALDWLKQQKGMYWQFKEAPTDALPLQRARPVEEEVTQKTPSAPTHPYDLRHAPALNPHAIPRRTFLGTHLGTQGVPAHMWSREHRTVFLLIDGTRSKGEILRLLPANFENMIDMILRDLKSAGLIE